jgi:hypothetical protein
VATARKAESRPVGPSIITPEELPALVSGHEGTMTLAVGPELAEALLGSNTGNRRLNARRVSQLADAMRASAFVNTGAPVIMSREGILNDGQHRLAAVVESGSTVEMDVRFGVPRAVFAHTDTGASRTPGDVLSILGVTTGKRVAAALRLLVLYERGLPESVRTFVSNAEVGSAHERWPDMEDVVARVGGHQWPPAVKSTPLYVTAFLASRAPGKTKLDSWLDSVATGLNASREDPTYQLRERLMRGVQSATREGMLEKFALMIKAWNLHAKGETVAMRDFKWVAVGKGAEPFPKVTGTKL